MKRIINKAISLLLVLCLISPVYAIDDEHEHLESHIHNETSVDGADELHDAENIDAINREDIFYDETSSNTTLEDAIESMLQEAEQLDELSLDDEIDALLPEDDSEVKDEIAEMQAGEQILVLIDAYFNHRRTGFVEALNTETYSSQQSVSRETRHSDLLLIDAELFSKNSKLRVEQNLQAVEQDRRDGISLMLDDWGIDVNYADAQYAIEKLTEITDGIYEVSVYEWTYFVWTSNEGKEIVSGFGTEHILLFDTANEQVILIADKYDESDISGINTAEQNMLSDVSDFRIQQFDSKFITQSDEIVQPMAAAASLPANPGSFTYSSANAVNYANSYVSTDGDNKDTGYKSYNKKYMNFRSIGGDCANFVSQSLYAGGLPMTTSWYYDDKSTICTSTSHYANSNYVSPDVKSGEGSHECTSDDSRSGSWAGSAYLIQALTSTYDFRVVALKTASVNTSDSYVPDSFTVRDDTNYIKKGNPIFNRWTDSQYDCTWSHVSICTNIIDNVPYINSHAKDRYNFRYSNDSDYSDKYYTVLISSDCSDGRHVYLNGSTICDICGTSSTGGQCTHSTWTWMKDATKHWKQCTKAGCNTTFAEGSHTYSGWSCTTTGTCVCGQTKASGHDDGSQQTESAHPHRYYKQCKTCQRIAYTGSNAPAKPHGNGANGTCSSCGSHSYTGGNCTTGAKCSCGAMLTAQGHDWSPIYGEVAHPHKLYIECYTCHIQQYTGGNGPTKAHGDGTWGSGTCPSCGTHTYVGRSCTAQGKCSCGSTISATGHSWGSQVYYESSHPHRGYLKCSNGCASTSYTGSNTTYSHSSCSSCGSHSYTGGSCTVAAKCSCSATQAAPGHTGGAATCNTLAKCTRCQQSYGSYAAHSWSPIYGEVAHPHKLYKECYNCHTQQYTGGNGPTKAHGNGAWGSGTCPSCGSHSYVGRTCTAKGTCSCGATIAALGHSWGPTLYDSIQKAYYHVCTRCNLKQWVNQVINSIPIETEDDYEVETVDDVEVNSMKDDSDTRTTEGGIETESKKPA